MATSPIYGWEEPDDTDLVKDGAAAIRTLGNAIDTTMATMVAKSIVDAKGDIIAATAADTVTRLAVGTNNHVLTADSTAATGLKWAVASAGAWTAFTPVVRQSATPTLTDYGSQYFEVGNYVFVQVAAYITSAGTANNEIRINLPVTSAAIGLSGDGLPAGTAYVYDQSANTYYQGFVTLYSTTQATLTSGLNKGLTTLTWGKTSSDCAITLANNDIVSAIFMYRKA